MKRISVVFLSFVLQAAAFGQKTADDLSADRELREQSTRYFEAVERRDAKVIDELLMDDCFVFYPRGVTDTKATLLETLRKPVEGGETAPAKQTLGDEKVRRAGETAILTGTLTTERGDVPPIRNRRTLTWVRQDGRWRLLHDQWSLLGDAREAEYWSDYFRGKNRNFNRKPNALLVEAIENVQPGSALDVGMGEGRNAIFLAKKGWNVTGVDRAEGALAVARQQANEQEVKITPVLQSAEDFDWGRERWDLIVPLYFVGVRENAAKIRESLKPGGLLVIEAFLAAAGAPGRGVEWQAGEMKKLFSDGFEILRYEETEGIADYGQKSVQLVRLVGRKTIAPNNAKEASDACAITGSSQSTSAIARPGSRIRHRRSFRSP
jgi:SAM-dependent methyltransferase